MRRLLVLLLFLAVSVRGAELPLSDPSIVPGSTFLARDVPVVVAGDGFLVAWTEYAGGWWPGPLMLRTYDADGTARQPAAVLVADGQNVHAVWTGREYLVVYARFLYRNFTETPAVFALRVMPDGTVLHESRTTVATTRNSASVHAMTWTGDRALVAVGTSSGERLIALDAEGRVVSDEPLAAPPAAMIATPAGLFQLAHSEGNAVAHHDATFAVIANGSAGVTVTFMNAQHQVQSAFTLAPNGKQARTIAWDGSAWVTAWTESDSESVCRARFTSATDVVRTCTPDVLPSNPALAVGNARTFGAWSQARAQIVTDGGLASTFIAQQTDVVATADAAGLLAAWIENDRAHPSAETRIHLGGYTSGGVRRPVRVLARPKPPREPQLAPLGGHSLLVWNEAPEILATRIDAVGNAIPPIVQLGTGYGIDVASNGRDALVTWIDNAQIAVALVTQNLDTPGVERFGTPATHVYFHPTVAATPGGFMLAWHETELVEPIRTSVRAQRYDANGLRIGGSVVVPEGDSSSFDRTTIGCGASSCLVTWRESEGMILAGRILGHDAQPRGERMVVAREHGHRDVILPRDDGAYFVAAGPLLALAGGNTNAVRWTNDAITLGGAVLTGKQPVVVYERGNRVYVRSIPIGRTRAVRH